MRRLVLIVALLVGIATPAQAAVTFLTSCSNKSSDTFAVTATCNTGGASLLVVLVVSHAPNPAPSFSDNKSNSWQPLTAQLLSNARARLYYCLSACTVGSSHTFTADSGGTASYPSIAVMAFSGTDAFDAESGSVVSSTSSQPGSITPAGDNELFITGIGTNSTGSYAVDDGGTAGAFTLSEHQDLVGGTSYGIAMAYKIQTTGVAENPTWSYVLGVTSAVMATFTAGAGGGSSAVPRLLLLGVGHLF